MEIKSTKNLNQNGVNILVYGHSGVGKTSLIKTLPSPIVLSAEAGLLPLKSMDIPYIEVKNMGDLKEAYGFLSKDTDFKSIAIDSISEIAEVVLNAEKEKAKDGRMAYAEMGAQMIKIIRSFIQMSGHNVYMSAKCEKAQDDTGRILHSPLMPGNKVAQQLPYFFDEVLALRAERNDEGNVKRALMCDGDGVWLAKDRSGKLNTWEAPDLGAVINKIMEA